LKFVAVEKGQFRCIVNDYRNRLPHNLTTRQEQEVGSNPPQNTNYGQLFSKLPNIRLSW